MKKLFLISTILACTSFVSKPKHINCNNCSEYFFNIKNYSKDGGKTYTEKDFWEVFNDAMKCGGTIYFPNDCKQIGVIHCSPPNLIKK